MKVTWLGHSCFKIINDNGLTIITDPYNNYIGYNLPAQKADIVTVSHSHKDHSAIENIINNPIIINRLGNYDINGVKIESTHSYHDNKKGLLRGENIIFKYILNGVTIVHLGDIGQDFDPSIIKNIKGVDILLIPVGGVYTIDYKMAKKYVDEIKPKVVIPMHYQTDKLTFSLDKVDKFLNLFYKNDIIYLSTDTFVYNSADFKEGISIVVPTLENK